MSLSKTAKALVLAAALALPAAASVLVVPAPAQAGSNSELMAIRMAKDNALRALAESVTGLKVRSNEVFFSDRPGEVNQESKVTAALRNVEYGRPKYDEKRGIAMVEATIRLGEVTNVIGRTVAYDDAVVRRFGFGTTTESARPYLQALRAAELDAYDLMARRLVGEKVDGRTKSRNLVLESDEVRTKVMAAVWGATVKDFGWSEDGNAYVVLSLDARYVKDVMGNRFRSTTDAVVEVTGQGATRDDSSKQDFSPAGRLYDPVDMKGIPAPKSPAAAAAPETGAAAR